MGARWQRLLAEAGKFMAVGGLATAVAFVLFNFLVHGAPGLDGPLAGHPIGAYVLANTVGMVISYQGTRSWAFRDREPVHADGGVTAYFVINVVTMAFPVACLWISRHVFGLDDPFSDNIAANVIGLTMGTWSRFYLFRRFVFRRPVALLNLYEELGEEFTAEQCAEAEQAAEVEAARRRPGAAAPGA